MPWCRGGGPKPKRTQNRVKARSRGGQAHPLAVCSPDPHLLGPPGRKLRGDRLQACPQPPTPGHQLLMGSAERPPQGGCLSDRLPQTHEGAQVQAEEARSRPWPQEDRSPLWAWDQRATPPPPPPSCPGTSPGLQVGTRGAHAILKHQRRELAHPTPTVGVPGEPHGCATRAGQPGMSAQVGCGVGGPAPGACQRWATGHHEVRVQAISSTAGGVQTGQVSQLLTFSERETGIGNSPVGLGRGWGKGQLSPERPSGHRA